MTTARRKYIDNTTDLERGLQGLIQRPLLALDVETEGLDPHTHKLLLLGIGDDREQLLVDCRSVSLEPLLPLLQGQMLKVTHNGAFDLAMLRACNIRCENVLDTMLIEKILQNGRRNDRLSLAALASRYLGVKLDKSERLSFTTHTGDFSDQQLEYASRDLISTYLILLEQMPELRRDHLDNTARIECEAVPAFADLAYDGVFLDRECWSKLIAEAKAERDKLRKEIDSHISKVVQTDLFGQVDINYESEAELREILTKLLGRPIKDLNKQSLKRLGHPIGELLLRYREQTKLVSTYGESFLESIHPRTGRIHADFQQIGAPTGRVSCSRPNMQNIPRGSRFRRCFRGPAGRKMVTADYSGCELRILAEVSADPSFVRIFSRGGDLHSFVASEIFGVLVSKDQNPHLRDRAKAINFGLAYGMGPGGLAQVTGLRLEEAEQLLKRYFRAFPGIKAYLESSAEQAIQRGYAQTIGGRRLYLGVGDAVEGGDLTALERVAKNMPIQGANADMLKVAMAGIRQRLLKENLDACMVNCVHDELLIEVAADDAWDVAEMAREEMVKAGERFIKKVPVVVDVSVEEYWEK
jgi:DNA polymerase-1